MSDEVYRLIGPHHNRMITVHPSPVRGMAQVSQATGELLKKQGWKRYGGPAQAEDGWVIPGTDPKLLPRSSFKVDI
jgi:hypothetical protein